MDQNEMSNFSKALLAAERALALFEGGTEDSYDFGLKADSSTGTLEIRGYTVYIRDEGPQRVMARNLLVGSFTDPIEAVVETVGHIIADQTKTLLREMFEETE
jgi:hypothetical protein